MMSWCLRSGFVFTITVSAATLVTCPHLKAQSASIVSSTQAKEFSESNLSQAEAELRVGIELSHQGLFSEAIPHFLAAMGHVADEYAAEFNLALCYVGTAQFQQAIQVLRALRGSGHANADVENLLAQAYIGNGQSNEGFGALEKAARLTPTNEKLYVFVADACAGRQDYSLGMRVVDLGLRHLPRSARLHYQRAYFLSLLDQFDDAKADFDLAASLAPHTSIAFLSTAQKNLFGGHLQDTIRISRAAIQEHRQDYLLLSILGDALIRSGATPGQPEFIEAQDALQKSVALRPSYPGSRLVLGRLFLMDNHFGAAVQHLERARQFDPRNPSVYSTLAIAYRKQGNLDEAEKMLDILVQLNADEAAKIRSAPGERKAVPGRTAAAAAIQTTPEPPH